MKKAHGLFLPAPAAGWCYRRMQGQAKAPGPSSCAYQMLNEDVDFIALKVAE